MIKNKPKVHRYRYCTGPSDCRGCWIVWVLLICGSRHEYEHRYLTGTGTVNGWRDPHQRVEA